MPLERSLILTEFVPAIKHLDDNSVLGHSIYLALRRALTARTLANDGILPGSVI
jgi:hypothetical protein